MLDNIKTQPKYKQSSVLINEILLGTGEFIRDLVALKSGGSGGVVWRIRANATKLVCAVGSRNGTEETKLLVLDFDAPLEK